MGNVFYPAHVVVEVSQVELKTAVVGSPFDRFELIGFVVPKIDLLVGDDVGVARDLLHRCKKLKISVQKGAC